MTHKIQMDNIINLPTSAIDALCKLGQDISEARRKRDLTINVMAERSGISRVTIGKIEKGNPTTSIGSYAAVLLVLGMEDRFADLVSGYKAEPKKLPQRIRIPNRQNPKKHRYL